MEGRDIPPNEIHFSNEEENHSYINNLRSNIIIKYNTNVPNQLFRGTEEAAGYDIRCNKSGVILPLSRAIITTGLQIEIPKGYYGKIESRSGLASKGIISLGGVIDSDYRGELSIILLNTDTEYSFVYEEFDKLAQIIFLSYHIISKEKSVTFSQTSRNDNGFGSTGM